MCGAVRSIAGTADLDQFTLNVTVRSSRTTRTRRALVAMMLLVATLLVVDHQPGDSPLAPARSAVRDGFASAGSGLGSLWPFGDGAEVKRLEAENAQLRTDLDAARGEVAKVADVERERSRLAELFDIKTPNDVPKTVARVIKVGASNFDDGIELDKGTDSGIRIGMPVETGAGLVGRVVQASRSRSTVQLVSDATFAVTVRYADSGDVGTASGQGAGKNLRGDLVALDSRVHAGELVVTSGTDGSLYPAGLVVGKVKTAESGGTDLRKRVDIYPGADLHRLDLVAVVQWQP